ncbi:hypothetical protein [Falsiroseomonas sp.]|uniref:hypothetical protein n=1 Tax=Falsiroseomonas sp. TaxID=2870721 RepID=UPI0034A548E3
MTEARATRRALIGTALAAATLPVRPLQAATGVPEAATLLVPGPEGGAAAVFAAQAAQGLARGLVQAAALRVSLLGGPDGITAANRFAASTAPDGRMLLVLTGPAAQALLVGDSRARYEPRHWPAIAGSLVPVLVAGRGALTGAQPLRLALSGPGAAEAGALLALDLIGHGATPVFLPAGLGPDAAVGAGIADAVVLAGPDAMARAAALGLVPWFGFDGERPGRDAALAEVASFGELLGDRPQPELVAASRAAGAALRVRGLLVLPALTSADAVALWRGAARNWVEEAREPEEAATRRVGGEDAADLLATLCPPAEAATAYRDWLRRRLNWQAG